MPTVDDVDALVAFTLRGVLAEPGSGSGGPTGLPG
jgi:hypothetical protein